MGLYTGSIFSAISINALGINSFDFKSPVNLYLILSIRRLEVFMAELLKVDAGNLLMIVPLELYLMG